MLTFKDDLLEASKNWGRPRPLLGYVGKTVRQELQAGVRAAKHRQQRWLRAYFHGETDAGHAIAPDPILPLDRGHVPDEAVEQNL